MEIKSVLREITLNQGEWFIHWRADFSPGPQQMNWQRTTGSSTKILINVSAVGHEKPTQYYRLVASWLGNTSTERKKNGDHGGIKFNLRQQCILAAMKVNHMLACFSKILTSSLHKMVIRETVRKYVVSCLQLQGLLSLLQESWPAQRSEEGK